MAAKILLDNDNNVTLQGYTLLATGAPVADALPSFTVYVDDGSGRGAAGPKTLVAVPGLSNVPMNYFSATGIYAGLLPGTALLTAGGWYWIRVTFANYNDVFSDWFQAVPRTSATG